MRLLSIFPALLLLCSVATTVVACGAKADTDISPPQNPVYRAELQQEINRIEPQLQYSYTP
jgi:hypothetical protein